MRKSWMELNLVLNDGGNPENVRRVSDAGTGTVCLATSWTS